MIDQLTVFLPNEPGTLAHMTSLLGEAGIQMHALMVSDTADFGIARIICDTPHAAARLLAGVYLVDALPAEVPEGLVLVTPAGAVARAGGLLDLWSPDGAPNPFARHAQLEDARAEREPPLTKSRSRRR